MYTLNSTEVHAVCYAIDQQGGKGGANYLKDICPTILSDSHGTPHAVCYGISAYESNAMKSSNPHSGIYIAETARTLDNNGGNPACNQGGVAIVTAVDCRNATESEINATLQGGADHNLNSNNVIRTTK